LDLIAAKVKGLFLIAPERMSLLEQLAGPAPLAIGGPPMTRDPTAVANVLDFLTRRFGLGV
jgi:hypothetical protein